MFSKTFVWSQTFERLQCTRNLVDYYHLKYLKQVLVSLKRVGILILSTTDNMIICTCFVSECQKPELNCLVIQNLNIRTSEYKSGANVRSFSCLSFQLYGLITVPGIGLISLL